MNFVIIGFISVVVVGVMEVVKNFLPTTVDKKVTSAISLGLAAVLPVGYGIVMKADPLTIVMSVIGVVGLTQTSYNFVLKLLKTLIEKLKTNVAKELTKE